MLEEGQPDRGDESRGQAGGGARGQGGSPPSETAAEVLQNGGNHGRRRTVTRVGVTAAVVVGVAVAAGIASLTLVVNSGGKSGTSAAAAGTKAKTDAAAIPLRVTSVTPAARSKNVAGAGAVQISFSAKLAPSSVLPTFHPAVAGKWQASGSTLSFRPDGAFAPDTRYTLRIPAGQSGLKSASGGVIAQPKVVRFETASYAKVRLAQVLGQLGYLPLTWQPGTSDKMVGNTAASGVGAEEQLAYNPPSGTFTWAKGYPASLRGQWSAHRSNQIVLGGVMAFQAQHNLPIDGKTTAKFWHKLFAAAAASQQNGLGYTYAVASKGSPESLTIWHNGRRVFHSLANTGIPVDPTADGTFPVYERFRNQVMRGTNPDGSTYADPVSFVAYFNGGDAVHYFPRGSYGFPQSLGCVELPYSSAQHAWPFLTYGSLVTVTG